MSEFFEDPENNTPDEPEEEAADENVEFEPDPATIAFLDQEAAAFAEVADEFETMYGFRHECHCDKDYAEGRVGEVTECYAGMIVEALATCAQLNYENKHLKGMVQSLMEMNNTLMDNVDSQDEDDAIQAEIDRMAGESGNDSD